jgi:hypothetical protein
MCVSSMRFASLYSRVDARRHVQGASAVCTAALVSDALNGALQQLFGYIGGAVLFEVVAADAESGRARIIVDHR